MTDSVILDRATRFLRSKALTEVDPRIVQAHRDLIAYTQKLDERRQACVRMIRALETESRVHFLPGEGGLSAARHLLEALEPLAETLEVKT
jgi:HrpA-like RNA helicase